MGSGNVNTDLPIHKGFLMQQLLNFKTKFVDDKANKATTLSGYGITDGMTNFGEAADIITSAEQDTKGFWLNQGFCAILFSPDESPFIGCSGWGWLMNLTENDEVTQIWYPHVGAACKRFLEN